MARRRDEDVLAGLLTILEAMVQPSVICASAARLPGRCADRAADAILASVSDGDSLVCRNAVRSLATLSGTQIDDALEKALSDSSPALRIAAARTSMVGWQRVQANPPRP
ncbi:MAG: hypothetical protein GY946_29695 [bacterium]|nr:hypothetical protein [bacterium]